MKNIENIKAVATLGIDYMGFIFHEKSPRNVVDFLPEIPKSIKKTGVFVNKSVHFILDKVKKYNLNAIQLHGEESPELCKALTVNNVEVIKAFSVGNTFNFSVLHPYEKACDYYLFDTKGKNSGGNGYVFNWNLLSEYPSKKPFFLSGGIGLENSEALKLFLKESTLPIYAIDVNSKFEISPALKDIYKISGFKEKMIFDHF